MFSKSAHINNLNITMINGLNYGDEGKGMATLMATIAAQNNLHQVANVKFNGSGQSSHRVAFKYYKNDESDTNEYEFTPAPYRYIGGGMFTPNKICTPTILASDVVIEPLILNNEISAISTILKEHDGVFSNPNDAKFIINTECRVTFPLDIIVNRGKETIRRSERHGSCGIGLFETVERNKTVPIKIKDLFSLTYCATAALFIKIENYYFEKHKNDSALMKYIEEEYTNVKTDLLNSFVVYIHQIFKNCTFNDVLGMLDYNTKYNHFILEGCQGLMLNETWGKMPNLTPSDTTGEQICKYLGEQANKFNISIHFNSIGVTRTFITRHGFNKILINKFHDGDGFYASPLPRDYFDAYKFEHNVLNVFQGDMVVIPLDLETMVARAMMNKSINHTALNMYGNVKSHKSTIVITHVDVLIEHADSSKFPRLFDPCPTNSYDHYLTYEKLKKSIILTLFENIVFGMGPFIDSWHTEK